MQHGYKNDRKMDPTGIKHEPKFILYPVLGNASSPGPERVIVEGNWDQTKIIRCLHWKKAWKMDPIRRSGRVQQTSISLPKFGLGPLGHSQWRHGASRRFPRRLFPEFGADFMICLLCLHYCFFDVLPVGEEQNIYIFLQLAQQVFGWQNPECIQKSKKQSEQVYVKNIVKRDLKKDLITNGTRSDNLLVKETYQLSDRF